MTSILIDPNALGSLDTGAADAFLEWVKASPAPAGGEHGPLLPGEVERATRATRTRDGLPVDETTWRGIADAARAAGVPDDDTTLNGERGKELPHHPCLRCRPTYSSSSEACCGVIAFGTNHADTANTP